MFWALWAHRCRSFPAAVSQWSEMVVKRTGPQAFVWTEKWGLHFPHKQNYSCWSPCQHKDCSKTCLSLWYFFTTDHQLISPQGRNSNKVLTFKRKLALWAKRSQEKRRDMFALLNDKSANVPPRVVGSYWIVSKECPCLALSAVKLLCRFVTTHIPGVNQDSPLWPRLKPKPEIDSGKCWRLPWEWTFHPFHADWLVSH